MEDLGLQSPAEPSEGQASEPSESSEALDSMFGGSQEQEASDQ